MAIFLAGKVVCYRILAFFCYGKLHFKCESADLNPIKSLFSQAFQATMHKQLLTV